MWGADAKLKTLSCEINTTDIVFLYLMRLLFGPETSEYSKGSSTVAPF
jgi:hypothetical protein